jgi:hypothetical protein
MEEKWALGHFLPGEEVLWRRMSGPDRRHAIGVARRAVADLGTTSREVVAAGLLHDVGKVEAGLGTWARAGVTVAAMAVGREPLAGWSGSGPERGNGRPGWRQRVGLYLSHDRVGADLLSRAGSDPFTVAWTAEHHRPTDRWSVDGRLGEALKVADDD